jgi:inorganic triphosphatase YgiF
VHIEREIKLHLRPEAEAALAALAPDRRSLLSVYFDTPRQELRRAGVALRLRRDGERWLQTLKAEGAAQAGLAARAEWELPVLGRALEPRRFPLDEVRRSTGVDLERLARRLRPTFETRFTRRAGLVELDGAGKAELAIDRGVIIAGARREAISEVELELVSGDSKALLRFAERLGLPLAYESKAERGYRLAAGGAAGPRAWCMPLLAPGVRPVEAFAALFAAALAQVGSNAAGMSRSRDPEYLHQLRVGLRRLRSALRAFAPLLRGARAPKRALQRIAPALGRARDADVLLQTLQAVRAAPVVVRAARGHRIRARRAALETVQSAEFRALLFSALRWLERRPWTEAETPLDAFGAERLEKLRRKAARRPKLESNKGRHRLRVRIKRLRYAGEFFAPCFPAAQVTPYLKALRALQDVLGELNDLAVARRLLRRLEVAVPAGLAAREKRLIKKLGAGWERFEKQRPYWRPPA